MATRHSPRALMLAGVLGCTGMLGGCGGLSNPELVRPGAVVNAIEVRNGSDQPITDLRIGICGQTFGFGPDYGHGRLEGSVIPAAGSRRFPASPGCYNIAVMIGGGFFASGRERFGTVNVPATPGEVGVWVAR